MRPNNPNKRLRGRNRSKNTNPLARSYESNGPDVKIRGSAMQVADKYAQLARDAQSSGDRIMAENYLQHAEHYYRIVAAAYEQSGQGQAQGRERREDGNRFDDRNFRGEQPTINGFDGVDDDDGGVRRTVRANGNGAHKGREADDEDDVVAHGQNGAANGHAEEWIAANAAQPADEQPEVEAATAAPAEEEPAPEPEKPKRRRTTRTRTRTRRTEAAADAPAAPEASEPGS